MIPAGLCRYPRGLTPLMDRMFWMLTHDVWAWALFLPFALTAWLLLWTPRYIRPLRALKRRWSAWKYLFMGPSMIQDGYDQVNMI